MKSKWKMVVVVSAVAVLAGSAGFFGFRGLSAAQARKTAKKQVIMFNVKHYTDDLHAAFMAIKLATVTSRLGARVTIFLNLEAVRMADRRAPNKMTWGTSKMKFSKLWQGFLKAGGRVLVCPHCAKAAGLTPKWLRKGARIGNPKQIGRLMLRADKIMTY